jgi:glucitol/sorbitol PTS system EIIA component
MELIYDLRVTQVGPLVDEFTEAGMWVFFHEGAPEELTEFALLHRAAPPLQPLAAGQMIKIDGTRYTVTAVGEVANDNLRNLGHLVLKANGADEPELPGDVCITEQPLPRPEVGTTVQVWLADGEVGDGPV